MEIQQFIHEFGEAVISDILSNVPEFIREYPKSAAYSTTRRGYILTHVSEKKPDEIYLHELRSYAEVKKLKYSKSLSRSN